MIKESSGAATKDTRSVDEGHEVYEEQRGCYEEHAERGRRTQSVRRATLLHEEQQSCYERAAK